MDSKEELPGIFNELFNRTLEQLASLGVKVEPGEVIKRIIAPVRDVYLKNLSEMLDSMGKRGEGGQGGGKNFPAR
jgi:hypothetical protein